MHNLKDQLTSPLKLLDVQILKSAMEFIPPNGEELNLNKKELFESYTIDVDYSITSKNDSLVLIFMKCGVNSTKEEPNIGYKLFVEIVNIFDISTLKQNLSDKEDYKKIITFSGLGIAINNIRNQMYTLTNQGPFKEYLLPALDVQSVIKMNSSKEKE